MQMSTSCCKLNDYGKSHYRDSKIIIDSEHADSMSNRVKMLFKNTGHIRYRTTVLMCLHVKFYNQLQGKIE